MQLERYVGLLYRAQVALADAFRQVGAAHRDEPDVFFMCEQQAAVCDNHAGMLAVVTAAEPAARFGGPREELLRDLHDLYLMAAECDLCWTLVGQAAQGARDERLAGVVARAEGETSVQLAWLRTRMKQAAPQALVVAD
ncbi:hypothetical protein [Symbioplanes lichenis]|uniref:hypothetical protein n=1 Tax=Symbioplanes lichenis TaxID=1629072 RepID=UPI00273959DB|nr:hypothetical protein [Actinoplanes lichenis]